MTVLERNAEAVNALNVYPVPDGDTGTNMLLTMRAVHEAVEACPDDALEGVAEAMAKGALLGARGNSGVISSQFLRGIAFVFAGKRAASAGELADALEEGTASAYKAVGNPVEGTMLTVMREAGRAGLRAADRPASTPHAVLRAAARAAALSVRKTPDLLDVLKQAGVVDAGGQGIALMLRAGALALEGKDPAVIRLAMPRNGLGLVRESFLTATDEERYGNCVQFTLEGLRVSLDTLRTELAGQAGSVVIIGDERLAKVHLHSEQAESVLTYARSVGALDRLKVENIDAQHRGFVLARRAERPRTPMAVVAVASGNGLERLFRQMGAVVVPGGQTMNPSCQQLLDAAADANADAVVLLPNNPNIVRTAQQAVELSKHSLRVVPARSVPQGIAAMLAANPEQGLEANLAAMERARASVRSGEVVAAVRAANVGGRDVPAGAFMGLLDDRLVAVGAERQAVLLELVGRAGVGEGGLVTLYWGGELTAAQAQADAKALRQRVAGLEVELVPGGQPYYAYLVSVE